MPSKQTQNYQLSQWVKSDKVLMEDFNKDNEKIDAALAKKADQSALEALSKTVTEESNARKSLDTSISRLGNCRMEYFTVDLAGSNGNPPTIRFSAAPEMFLIVGVNFIVGSRHMDFLRRFTSSTYNYPDNLAITWSGNSCTLASALSNVHHVFAFYRKDL